MNLQEENEFLRQQVRELKGARDWPSEWLLSRAESGLLSMLVSRNIATRGAIMAAMYSDDPDPPEQRIIDVFIQTLRRKIKAAPIQARIYAKYGVGYYMPAADRAALLALMTS